MQNLPRGAVVVYRAFGDPGAETVARALRRITRARGQRLLIGADARLARRVRADGIHLPQRLAHKAAALRRAQPRWLISAAAHDRAALVLCRRAGVDAALVSAVFPSRSASARSALGPVRFASLVRLSLASAKPVAVIALGGVGARTGARLIGAGASGLAAVDGLVVTAG